MALPTLSAHWPSRHRGLERQMARQREQEARARQQWQIHYQYFRDQELRTSKQAEWSSRQSYQQSMAALGRGRLEEEKRAGLEQRRARLRGLLQAEGAELEAELRELLPDGGALTRQLLQKTEELRSAREERRSRLAQQLLKEHWKKNNPELRKMESALHKDHVVSQWQTQTTEKKQQEAAVQEEAQRFEEECERSRRDALEKMRQEEEKRRAADRERAEELRKQMEELKLREEEASRLKKEQEVLASQRWELERLEEERREVEKCRKKSEMGHFLIRQYRAQLKRRAQQVQEELEADRRILAWVLEGEQAERWQESARRERAVADAAWMKHVIEEQLQLERQREAQFDVLYREEAQRVWESREAEWEKEKRARERLMHEVLSTRQQQLEVRMGENRAAQEESLRRREELLLELEEEKHNQRLDREAQESCRTARMHDINAQVEQRRQEQWEEDQRTKQEEEEERERLRLQEEELRLETQRMAQQGFQDQIRSRPRSAWT